jgi:hypothetical protein
MEEKQSLVSAAPTEKPPLRDEENSSLLEAQPISMVVEDTTIKRRRRFLVGAATFALLFLLGIGLNMNRSAAASPEAQTLFADKIQDETTTNVTITTTTSAAATNDSNSSSSIDSGGVSENSSPSALKLTWCNVRANIVCILYKHRTNCLDESKHNCAPEVYPSPPKDYDDDNDDNASKK